MATQKKSLLVVGASGVIGSAVVEHAVQRPDWRVCCVSRRPPALQAASASAIGHIPLDLTRKVDCEDVLGRLAQGITHVVYAAAHEIAGLIGGWMDRGVMQTNLLMLQNALQPLRGSRTLEHVTIMQGTKAYGAHVHPVRLPLVESAVRDAHENFYWLQEDYLREFCAEQSCSWTIFRPQVILGGACGVAMNPIPIIGAYAALCRERGIPCAYPGTHAGIWEATDARLVSAACLWAADATAAREEIFNITNGDVWVPDHQWESICGMLGVDTGANAPVDFSRFVEENAEDWQRLARRWDLQPLTLRQLCGESHHYLNLLLCNGQPAAPWPPALVSTVKIRQAGFGECFSTLDSMRYWFTRLEQARLLPAMSAAKATRN